MAIKSSMVNLEAGAWASRNTPATTTGANKISAARRRMMMAPLLAGHHGAGFQFAIEERVDPLPRIAEHDVAAEEVDFPRVDLRLEGFAQLDQIVHESQRVDERHV